MRRLLLTAGVLLAVGCSAPYKSSTSKAVEPVNPSTTSIQPSTTDVLDASSVSSTVATVPTTTVATTPPPIPAPPPSPPSVAAAAPVTHPQAPTRAVGNSSFEQCVITRESGGNPHAGVGGLYGILPSTWHSLGYSGTAAGASVAQQKAAFDTLYTRYGESPWSAYDGCR